MLEKAVAEGIDQLGEVKKAPRMPIVLVVELETLVNASADAIGVDKTRAIVAWMRLLKLYGAMRADDLQRVRPDSVSLGESGLVLKLLRTKVSGPGKRVRELMVFVPVGTGIHNTTWMTIGYDLWKSIAVMDADFFLPRPTADLAGFTKSMASRNDLATLGTWCAMSIDQGRPWGLGGSPSGRDPRAFGACDAPVVARDPWRP